MPLTRARAVVARARQKGCTLLVTDGDWQGASTRLEARVCGYEITGGRPTRIRTDQQGAAGEACAGGGRSTARFGQSADECSGSTSRVLAIWCMDWPAVAAAAAAGLPATAPVAVTLANRVIACSSAARAVGVRRGLRRREASARCPQLHVVAADADRDARFFEEVIAAVDDLVPRAEVLRPGLLVLPVRGAARYLRVRAAPPPSG